MIEVLKTEDEGIVRAEAAAVMRVLHENQLIPATDMPAVYDTMAKAAIGDLHWEVKSNAIDFWGKVFLNHLADEGFIDGSFPNITFSKTSRKIVTLTDREVQRRLVKVLQQLSGTGCLAVFIEALKDDCDIAVNEKALVKMNYLKHLFKRHNFTTMVNEMHEGQSQPSPSLTQDHFVDPFSSILNTPPTSDLSSPQSSTPSYSMANDVIDDIVSASDMHLLADVCHSNHSESVQRQNGESGTSFTTVKYVSAETFLAFSQQDLEALIQHRRTWLENTDNFSSLLDDMVATCSDDDVNKMDCY